MCAHEPLARLRDDAQRDVLAERAALVEICLQIHTVQQLHHEVRIRIAASVEHGRHVTRIDLRGRARLACEPIDQLLVAADRDLFDGDAPAGVTVARFVDDTHAAAADLADHLVAAADHARRFRRALIDAGARRRPRRS